MMRPPVGPAGLGIREGSMSDKYTNFIVDNTTINYNETLQVKDGVVCDTYAFEGDTLKDLAIVTVRVGFKTPLQRVMKGEQTIEGFFERRRDTDGMVD